MHRHASRFSEIALLLPHHDITLVFFGPGVHHIVAEGKKKTKSIAGQASLEAPIFSYTAPLESGSGSIKIYLHGSNDNWEYEAAKQHGDGHVDALIALNGGLASYKEWLMPIRMACLYSIPFASTEYAEQSAEHQVANIAFMVAPLQRPQFSEEIKVNPFARPGQRGLSQVRMPNLYNGFTVTVWRNEEN
jgi:hypothetical protein